MGSRRARMGVLLFLLAAAGGCAEERGQRGHWLARLTPDWLADSGQVEFALAEEARPACYLCDGLWRETDELALPLEQRTRLEANGLRVGLVNGAGSAKLQGLLTRKESCPVARRLTSGADQETPWPLRGGVAKTTLEFTQQGQPYRMDLEDAEFGLALRLRPAPQGKTLVRFEPYAKHKDAAKKLIAPDLAKMDWKLNDSHADLRFPELAWEFTLGPNDYLAISGRPDKPGRFGALAFVDEAKNVQRVMVVRGVGRPTAAPETSGPLPLAWQATARSQ